MTAAAGGAYTEIAQLPDAVHPNALPTITVSVVAAFTVTVKPDVVAPVFHK